MPNRTRHTRTYIYADDTDNKMLSARSKIFGKIDRKVENPDKDREDLDNRDMKRDKLTRNLIVRGMVREWKEEVEYLRIHIDKKLK